MTIYLINSQYDGLMHDNYFTSLDKANEYLASDKSLSDYCYVTAHELEGK
jgi:hypothetical protein